jgi:hypothetical protein
VTGPFTGGQKVAHDPVHLDAVAVSGPNQYTVKPAAGLETARTAGPDRIPVPASAVAAARLRRVLR